MQRVVHRLVDGVLHRGHHRDRSSVLIADQVIEHCQLRALTHFLRTADTGLRTVALDDEVLPVRVLELPPDVGEVNLGDVLLQEVGVVMPELKVFPHVLDPVLDRVGDVQRQVDFPEARDLTVHSDVEEQVLTHQGGLGDPAMAQVDDPLAAFGQRIEHPVVDERSLVFLTLLTVHQLDEGHELEREGTRDVAPHHVIVGGVEVLLDCPGSEDFGYGVAHAVRPPHLPKASKLTGWDWGRPGLNWNCGTFIAGATAP